MANKKIKVLGLLVLLIIFSFLFYLAFFERSENLVTEREEVGDQKVERQTDETQKIQEYCQSECSHDGQRRCAPGCLTGNQYQICGNYDDDKCLEWSSPLNCPAGKICKSGQCVERCISDCSYSGQIEYRCNGDWRQARTCLDWDVDPCLEWSTWTNIENCGSDYYEYQCSGNWRQRRLVDKYCSGGSCGTNYGFWQNYQDCGTDSWADNYRCQDNWVQREKKKRGCSDSNCYDYSRWENYKYCGISGQICQSGRCVPTCTNECSYAGGKRCIGYIGYLVCGEFDNDFCLDWSSPQLCPPNYTCENSVCVAPEPSHQSSPPPAASPQPFCPTCQPGPNPP